MLTYFKMILAKVSFNQELFEKELRKALSTLIPNEIRELKKWCYLRFGITHKNILQRNFLGEVSI
jgi:hypothetical protein